MERWLERTEKRLNSEAFQSLVRNIQYDDLTRAHRELADVIGVEATLKLCEIMDGSDLYIPENRYFFHLTRNQKIFDCRQKGASTAQLAKQFHLSEVSVRRILRDAAKGRAPYCPASLARMISAIGSENARKLCETMGGTFHFPINARLKQYLRNLEIHEEFYGQGRGVAELAEKYNLTVTSIRRVINTRPKNLNPGTRRKERK